LSRLRRSLYRDERVDHGQARSPGAGREAARDGVCAAVCLKSADARGRRIGFSVCKAAVRSKREPVISLTRVVAGGAIVLVRVHPVTQIRKFLLDVLLASVAADEEIEPVAVAEAVAI